MKLVEIIQKSRRLVDKLFTRKDAKFTNEDYLMLSVSLFVATKESIVKKNNLNNTLYFDYRKNKELFDKMTMIDLYDNLIEAEIPNLGKFDLTEPHCFDGIENLVFPFYQKIEIENCDLSPNEINEIKRIIWIYSKIRDSFVHGDKYSFDVINKKIIISNSMSNDTMGSFRMDMIFSPELLNFLSGIKKFSSNIYHGFMDEETWERYNSLYKGLSSRKLETLDKSILEELEKDIVSIENTNELYALLKIVKEYRRVYPRMSESQREKYSDKIIQIILAYSRKNKLNQEKSAKLLYGLSEVLDTDTNLYHLALYSHMVFVFSNLENLSIENVRTNHLKIENDIYSRKIKKLVSTINDQMLKLTNPYIDKEITRDYIVENINHIMQLLEIRNKWIINNLRNGIEHKNVKVESDYIEIFDRKDNQNESEIDFLCRAEYEDIDYLLRCIENPNFKREFSVHDFIEEIKNICGDGDISRKFAECLTIFENYITSKNENVEDDEPPKF